jgi:hypothetical protein
MLFPMSFTRQPVLLTDGTPLHLPHKRSTLCAGFNASTSRASQSDLFYPAPLFERNRLYYLVIK